MRTITLLIAVLCVSGCSTYQVPKGTSSNPEIRDLQTRVGILEHRAGIRVKQPPRTMTNDELVEEMRRRGIVLTAPYPEDR